MGKARPQANAVLIVVHIRLMASDVAYFVSRLSRLQSIKSSVLLKSDNDGTVGMTGGGCPREYRSFGTDDELLVTSSVLKTCLSDLKWPVSD